jgi:hypothetical protein
MQSMQQGAPIRTAACAWNLAPVGGRRRTLGIKRGALHMPTYVVAAVPDHPTEDVAYLAPQVYIKKRDGWKTYRPWAWHIDDAQHYSHKCDADRLAAELNAKNHPPEGTDHYAVIERN